jgi:hypothetical protein
MYDDRKRRWISKETVLSPWRELAGEHTASEIWKMRQQGRFAVAIPRMTDSKAITPTEPDDVGMQTESHENQG